MTTIATDQTKLDPGLEQVNILGTGVSSINMASALLQIDRWIQQKTLHYICVTNVHVIMEARRNPALRRVLNRAGMVTPDGMPLVWLSRLKGHPEVERVYGPDLLLAVCERSLLTGWKHYFFGGTDVVNEKLIKNLSHRFSGLAVAGWDIPPFRMLTPDEDRVAVEKINQSNADIVWVGLGAPKQESWMAEHICKINAPLMIGVGAAFDFHAGLKPQAPKWMQRFGLEWCFRLATEPRRLWKRYLLNNPLFLILILLQFTGLKTFPIEK